jgi:hypothetical protein
MTALFAEVSLQAGEYSRYVVGWGTLSLINAGLAQAKFRSGLLWWLLSLLLGPVATFILVVFFPRPALPERYLAGPGVPPP